MTATVFIVDDDAAVRCSLCSLLEASGFQVKSYVSAQEFLTNYEPASPACLLTDFAMPEMSGLELLRALAERGIKLPTIFLTAYGDVPLSVEAMKTGAIDFFEKPVSGPALISRVNDALIRDQQQHDRAASLGPGTAQQHQAEPDARHFLRFRPPRLRLDGAAGDQTSLPHIRLDRAMDFLLGDKLA